MTKFTVEQGAYMGAIKLFFMRQKEKVRLKKAFKNAGLIIKHKSGDKDIHLPKIHDVVIDKEKTTYVFTLINVMDQAR